LWSLYDESCPEGTIPIRRAKEEDILRASSIDTFGRKLSQVETDATEYKHVVCNHRNSYFLSLNIFCFDVFFSYSFSFFMQIIISFRGINAKCK